LENVTKQDVKVIIETQRLDTNVLHWFAGYLRLEVIVQHVLHFSLLIYHSKATYHWGLFSCTQIIKIEDVCFKQMDS